MGSGRAEQIEGAADAGAALLLAVALGYILGGLGADPALRLALPGLAFFGCFYGLRRLQPRGAFPLRGFTP